MRVKDILKEKRRPVITIGAGETAQDAVARLVEHNIGAMPVLEKDKVVGIISERDLMRHCSDSGGNRQKIRDIMTRDVCFCVSEDEIDYVMNSMMQNGIRHLPVMEGETMVGIVSSRDVMEARLEACQVTVRHLSDYISGGYK